MQTTLPLNEHDGLEHVNAAINMFIINIEIYEAPGLHCWMTRNLPHLPVHSVAAPPPDRHRGQKQHRVQGKTGCLDLVTECQHLLPVLMSSTTVCQAIDGFANWQ